MQVFVWGVGDGYVFIFIAVCAVDQNKNLYKIERGEDILFSVCV